MATKAQIDAGRLAVDAYRAAHSALHIANKSRLAPGKHTPLLEEMKKELAKQGFDSPLSFWKASHDQNAIELGFKDYNDFKSKVTIAHQNAMAGKWR